MSRSDLLALSPESLAALANPGLVKRAQREIAAGGGPELEEDEAGVVVGRFKDGVVARLVPGLPLSETPCSCGAVATCRHRVAVALAYPAWIASKRTEGAPAWSPAQIDEQVLERVVGRRGILRARALLGAGLIVEVRRDEQSAGSPVPCARLPTCAVRFLVPNDLSYARCDCAAAGPCEHIAVAVWAFKEAEAEAPNAAARAVELRGEAPIALDLQPLAPALDLARDVLIEGVSGASVEHLGARFSKARADLLDAGLVWPAEILEDLEASLHAYKSRSARYSAAAVASLVTELGARARAALSGGELPARFLLGADEAQETKLKDVRLISIGARVDADGLAREADVYLADAASGVVLVTSKRWTFAEGDDPEEGPSLARRRFAGRATLSALATGQLLSRDVVRRANRRLGLRGRGAEISVTPQAGAIRSLPKGLLVEDIKELLRSQEGLPPRLLRPRVLTESMRVIAVGSVGEVVYWPAQQEVTAEIRGAAGGAIELRRSHRKAAPYAIEAIVEALQGSSRLLYVSGSIRRSASGEGLFVDPVMLVTDRVIVPDLEPARALSGELRMASGARSGGGGLAEAIEGAASCLEEACHLGIVRAGAFTGAGAGWCPRAEEAAERLSEVGLRGASDRLRIAIKRAREAQVTGDKAAEVRAADAWMSASIRLSLAADGR